MTEGSSRSWKWSKEGGRNGRRGGLVWGHDRLAASAGGHVALGRWRVWEWVEFAQVGQYLGRSVGTSTYCVGDAQRGWRAKAASRG